MGFCWPRSDSQMPVIEGYANLPQCPLRATSDLRTRSRLFRKNISPSPSGKVPPVPRPIKRGASRSSRVLARDAVDAGKGAIDVCPLIRLCRAQTSRQMDIISAQKISAADVQSGRRLAIFCSSNIFTSCRQNSWNVVKNERRSVNLFTLALSRFSYKQ